ncbi:hypothetical protein [Pseudarthrobacter albicanus]|uniref:hypothetical protein n=1 Tax=Pseudarthrobacter albicanus TaxID=2823873 RepID=UPI001BAD56C9|nr:hypothetical protein [Pseudarthrobacter albicanus]
MSETVATSDDEQLLDAEEWPEHRDGELLLDGPQDLLLWRQVHPNHVTSDGIIGDQAFSELVDLAAMRGTPEARDEVSMSRADEVDAEEAYQDWVARGRISHGSFGVTVGEVTATGCRTIDDSARLDPDEDVPGHVYVDMRKYPEKPKETKRRIRSTLAAYATHRRRQFPLP